MIDERKRRLGEDVVRITSTYLIDLCSWRSWNQSNEPVERF